MAPLGPMPLPRGTRRTRCIASFQHSDPARAAGGSASASAEALRPLGRPAGRGARSSATSSYKAVTAVTGAILVAHMAGNLKIFWGALRTPGPKSPFRTVPY